MKNGVPFEIAFEVYDVGPDSLDGFEKMALSIVLGQLDGGELDWATMQWKKKDS